MIDRLAKRLTRLASKPDISANSLEIGKGVVFGSNVRIKVDRLKIGDGVKIGDNVKITCSEFEIGDFGTIYHDCFFPSPGSLRIGNNFWLGNNSIIDSQGGTIIGDNVGIGAHSQLWTHMKYGDLLNGCRFHSTKPLTIGNDVWLVGHNLVSPVNIGDEALVMLGSLIIKDIPPEAVVAGSPSNLITEKTGKQFKKISLSQKRQIWESEKASKKREIQKDIENHCTVVETFDEFLLLNSDTKTIICLEKRLYKKIGTSVERRILRSLLPNIKLNPFLER